MKRKLRFHYDIEAFLEPPQDPALTEVSSYESDRQHALLEKIESHVRRLASGQPRIRPVRSNGLNDSTPEGV